MTSIWVIKRSLGRSWLLFVSSKKYIGPTPPTSWLKKIPYAPVNEHSNEQILYVDGIYQERCRFLMAILVYLSVQAMPCLPPNFAMWPFYQSPRHPTSWTAAATPKIPKRYVAFGEQKSHQKNLNRAGWWIFWWWITEKSSLIQQSCKFGPDSSSRQTLVNHQYLDPAWHSTICGFVCFRTCFLGDKSATLSSLQSELLKGIEGS